MHFSPFHHHFTFLSILYVLFLAYNYTNITLENWVMGWIYNTLSTRFTIILFGEQYVRLHLCGFYFLENYDFAYVYRLFVYMSKSLNKNFRILVLCNKLYSPWLYYYVMYTCMYDYIMCFSVYLAIFVRCVHGYKTARMCMLSWIGSSSSLKKTIITFAIQKSMCM